MTAGELERRLTVREMWEWAALFKAEETEWKKKQAQQEAAAKNKSRR